MFMGEFNNKLDAKGRMIVPSKFREDLSEQFVITRGLDKCLFGYTHEEWSRIEEKMKNLPLTKRDARKFMRLFFSGATAVEVDKQGRINIPQNLRTYAGLSKDCTIIGVSSRIEIWDSEEWSDFYTDSEENFEDIAEDLIDFDLYDVTNCSFMQQYYYKKQWTVSMSKKTEFTSTPLWAAAVILNISSVNSQPAE